MQEADFIVLDPLLCLSQEGEMAKRERGTEMDPTRPSGFEHRIPLLSSKHIFILFLNSIHGTTLSKTHLSMSTFSPASRHSYTPSQIQAYFSHINLPTTYRSSTTPTLTFLTVLLRHQLASVPFENLELHDSDLHTISLDPQHLFHKIVERDTRRGGYCIENSCLFRTVLRSLGFEVRSVGAKVNEVVQPVSGNRG